MSKLPALLVIMDGMGWAEPGPANAVSLAHTPHLDALMETYPYTTIATCGPDVGLPEGQMGNSEVGHLNIGAGRVVMQELMRLDNAIETGEFFENPQFRQCMDEVAKTGATLHIMGLVSDGGVHSSIDHCLALLHMAAERGVRHVRIHAFLDGRDVAPDSGIGFIRTLSAACANTSELYGTCDARIASVSGRYYAMDRDNRWNRISRAWEAIVLGRGTALSAPVAGVQASYDSGITDEFVVPFSCDGSAVADGDAVIFFNFRPDRARELTRAFTDPGFSEFDRGRVPRLSSFVTMTEYDPTFDVTVAFPKNNPQEVLADVLAEEGLRQLHTAETEKYAHVTFFINGGVEEPKPQEQRILVASPQVATYDLQPEMSAPEVSARLVEAINGDAADVYIVNFANPDMVGHTGVLDAAIKAVEAADEAMGAAVDAIRAKGGVAIVTADHGNADCMFIEDDDGVRKPMTAHTLARAPFIVIADDIEVRDDMSGRLCDVAPTLLDLVGIEKPSCWTGESLLQKPAM